jgi:integrase
VHEVLERWLTLRQDAWAYSTTVGYRHAIRHHLVPYLGHRAASELTVRHVEEWQVQLLEQGLSPSTVRQARVVLSQAVDMLVRHGQLNTNPVPRALGLPKPASVGRALTAAEARAVLGAAEDPTDRARWLLALTLGLRSGEVLGLRWSDVHLETSPPRLTVTGSLQFQAGRGLVRAEPKTAASRRAVPLAPEHVAALRAVQAEQRAMRAADAADFNPEGYVFITRRGTPFDPANDAKRWTALLDAAGVPRVRRHDARHTAATLLLSSGAGIGHVQKTLGHASIRTTVDVYGHLTADDSAAFTATVARLLSVDSTT